MRHYRGTERRGREAISGLAREFRDGYDESPDMESAGDQIRTAYKTFHHKFQSYIGHYFRNLYQILRFINDSQAREEDKNCTGG